LLAERPLLLFGKYRPTGQVGRIEVSGISGRGRWSRLIEVRRTDARPENAALQALWARKWVEILEDERTMNSADQLRKAITDLGLAYDLLTTFTSFVAVDSEVANRGGPAQRVRQALPMPAGVPNSAIGVGGLGLMGIGIGAGGVGEGTIGFGNFGTIGRGGKGAGSGYGRGFSGSSYRAVSAPEVIPGMATVRGSLDKDIIKRIIRRHINEVRYCYEQELGKKPDLEGRVAVQFVIGSDGTVTSSSVSSSTLGNPQVETCISSAVRRWKFPAVKGGGVVIVSYPFALRPKATGRTNRSH
jgi:TonB family protein